MVITNFSDIKETLMVDTEYRYVSVPGADFELQVIQYLPIEQKGQLITAVVDAAIDEATGCFSPIRTNVYFALEVLKWYCNMSFDGVNPIEAYDLLENNGVINAVLDAIPEEERAFLEDLVDSTIEDISRYNNSFAGMMQNMTGEASKLGDSLEDILQKIKNREGLEILDQIKTVVGND